MEFYKLMLEIEKYDKAIKLISYFLFLHQYYMQPTKLLNIVSTISAVRNK